MRDAARAWGILRLGFISQQVQHPSASLEPEIRGVAGVRRRRPSSLPPPHSSASGVFACFCSVSEVKG